MKLSDGEKLILLMLTDMYKNLKVKGEFDPEFISETIHSDNLWGFNWRFTGIPFERSKDPPEVSETVDYMDMWSFLEDSYKKLSPADKKRVEKEAEPFGKHVEFHGFDGNNEPHYHVARYMVEHLERFPSFAKRDLNSHSPSIDMYARMYRVFEPMRAGLGLRLLNADEIIQILQAMLHPSHRKS
jgi:uncharacterized protein YfbU (UPF0304 family)